MKYLFFLVCIFTLFTFSAPAQKVPVISELKEIAQLPAKYPQRVMALAYDGNNLWIAVYLDRGSYAKYDPKTNQWDLDQDPKLRASIVKVTGRWASAGGMVFADGKMWLSSVYGESFGWIDIKSPEKSKTFSRYHVEYANATQSYADFAFDGTYIWSAWSVLGNQKGKVKNELLLKIDRETGAVVEQFTLLKGNRPMMAHGLSYVETKFWHAKDNVLSSIDKYGVLMGQFELPGVKRVAGLAWDGESLWIVEFTGKLWRLPFKSIP